VYARRARHAMTRYLPLLLAVVAPRAAACDCGNSTITGKWCLACDCGVHHPGSPVEGCECKCSNR
jgi:hypothetical protein